MADKPESYLTLKAFARDLGIDRSTLVRYEQRRIVPAAPFYNGGRVYSTELQKQVREAVQAYSETKFTAGYGGVIKLHPSQIRR